MKFKAELVDYYLANSNELSIPAIAAKIIDDFKKGVNGIHLSKGTIINYLYTIRREQMNIVTINNTPLWRVQDGKYLFEYGNTNHVKVFSVDLVDKIFLYYSRRGYNFTRTLVRQRFDITVKTWNEIARVFHLSKDSDIISPYTKESTSKEELEMLLETLQNEIVNSGEMTTRKSQEALERQYRKVIERDKKDYTWRDTIMSDMMDHNFDKITVRSAPSTNNEEIDWNITDMHAGSKSTKMLITEDWSIEILEEKMDRIAQIINSYGAKKNHLNFLGDLVETISGVNHPDSWKLIQDGHFGSKAIIFAYELVARFVAKVNNVASVNGVGGNHDRLQASNKLADTGATDLVFYFLEKHLNGSEVEVNYHPVMLAFAREKYGVILGHGDKNIHRRALADQILLFAVDKNQFIFINLGHLHTFIVKDSQHIGRVTTNPSIITGNPYSDVSIGKSDKSGFTGNTVNMFDEPRQIVENI